MKTYRQFIHEEGNYSGTGAITGMGYGSEVGVHIGELIQSETGVEHEDELFWPLFRRYDVIEDLDESVDNTGIDDAVDAVDPAPKGPFGKPGASKEDKAIVAKFKDQQEPIWPMVDEDIGNTAGGGAIAGIGVGPQGEPGVDVKNDDELSSRSRAAKKPIWPMMKRKPQDVTEDMFAGAEVFDVSHDVFARCRLGKLRYHRWSRYVGDDAIGQKIRAYGIANPNKSIVIRDKRSGSMMFLRHAAVPSFAAFCMS